LEWLNPLDDDPAPTTHGEIASYCRFGGQSS
jgi:hypothetical protein